MSRLANERFKEWLYKKPARNAILLTANFFILFLLLFHPRFDTNDDVRQAMIASGVGITESPDPHILFPHIYLGELLSTAYSHLPAIPWYGLMLYLALFTGIFMLVYVLLKKEKSPWLWLLWAALPLALNVQYTGVAFVLVIGSVLAGLKTCSVFGNRTGFFRRILLLIPLLIASMIRWEAFLLALVLLVAAFGLEKKGWPDMKKLALLGGLLILAFGLHFAHTHRYDSDPEWKDFRRHNALRGEITDYNHVPFNGKTASLYQEIGWTKSAFQLYQSWFLADQEVHSVEKVEKLVAAQKWAWRWDSERIGDRLISLPAQNLFAGLLFIPIFMGFFYLEKKQKRSFILLFLFAASLLLYLAFTQWLHNRISLPVMAFLLFWVHLHQTKKRNTGFQIALISFSLLYFSAYLYRDFQEKKRMNIAEQSISRLASGEHRLFAIWADSFPYEYVFRPFHENRNLLRNMSLLPLGMTVYTPFFEEKMKEKGFSNIHDALQDSNSFLIARPELLPVYQQFMQEYYGKNISFKELLSQKEISFYIWNLK